MKRVRGDEPMVKAAAADERRVMDVATGAAEEASPGSHANRSLVVNRSASPEPVLVASAEPVLGAVAVAAAGANEAQDVVAAGPDEAGKGIVEPVLDEIYADAIYNPVQARRESDEFSEEASDDGTEEESDDVASDKEDRDRKSRSVLQRLKDGQITFRRNEKLFCPFRARIIQKDRHSMIQHAMDVGKGRERKHKPATLAKHAAFGLFLRKYAGAV